MEEFKIDATLAALNGGEDYELLFTLPLDYHEQIKNAPGISIIGHVTDKAAGNFMVGKGSEQMIPLKAQGWESHKADT